jgi:hypothetical protein
MPHFIATLEELRTLGVRFIAITQGIDTDESNPAGRLMLTTCWQHFRSSSANWFPSAHAQVWLVPRVGDAAAGPPAPSNQ